MANYSLDQLRSDIDSRYGALVIDLGDGQEPVTLLPVLRLDQHKRAAFYGLLDELASARQAEPDDEDEEDPAEGESPDRVSVSLATIDAQLAVIRKALDVIAKDDGSAARLAAALPDSDPATLLTLWERYMEVAQPGEAKPSET
jgi:hypothetical protein